MEQFYIHAFLLIKSLFDKIKNNNFLGSIKNGLNFLWIYWTWKNLNKKKLTVKQCNNLKTNLY